MAGELKLNKPWLVAVWPGMGHVAISAGYYLVAKLGMHILAEFSAHELFDVEHVEVKGGLIRTGRLPRSRFFAWKDPHGEARHRRVHRRGPAAQGAISPSATGSSSSPGSSGWSASTRSPRWRPRCIPSTPPASSSRRPTRRASPS